VNSRIPDLRDDDAAAIARSPVASSRVILGWGLLVALVIAVHWMDAGSMDMIWRDTERMQLVERHGAGTERIAKLVLHLQATGPGPARDRLLSELDQFLAHWDRSYDLLREGVVDSLATSHSREVESIYCELNSMQWGLLSSGRALVNAIRRPQPGPLNLDPYVADVLRFERENLQGIERLARQYRRDARERMALGQIYSRVWLTLVVAALAASGWWVLRSLVKQLDLAGLRLNRSRSELLAARQTAGSVLADHRRLVSVVQIEARPALARILTACDCAAEQSDSPAVRQQIDSIDTVGRRVLRLLNELLPNRANIPAAQQASPLHFVSPAESPSQQNCEESELFACSATQNR
jgi:hypothetical protein